MIYQQITGVYWWKSLWVIVKRYCKTCKKYQCRDKKPVLNIIHSTSIVIIFKKVTIDIIYIPEGSRGKKYLIIKRENLIGWSKAKTLTVIDLINIIKFLWEDFIC